MEKSAHIQYVSDEWLIGRSWLRLISTCWQSVCIYEVGGIYLLTPICLRVITVCPSQVGGILIPNRWSVQSTADQLVAATTCKLVLNSKKKILTITRQPPASVTEPPHTSHLTEKTSWFWTSKSAETFLYRATVPLWVLSRCSGSSPHFKEMLVRSVMDSEDKSIAVDYRAWLVACLSGLCLRYLI